MRLRLYTSARREAGLSRSWAAPALLSPRSACGSGTTAPSLAALLPRRRRSGSLRQRQRLEVAWAAAAQQVAASGEQPAPAALRSLGGGGDDVLLEFRDVHKSFGSKPILRGASFKIRRGEAVGIIGSSGTGKSTTLRLAAGLLAPDKGEVIIKGHARQGLLSDDDTSDSLKVGLVFQSGALFDSLTVGENVGFLLHEHTDLPKEKVDALVAESLGKVGLSGVEKLYPSELSGGMKKRVALARAIVRDERHDDVEQLLLYDEPTAGLDPVASTVVEDLIRSLHYSEESQHLVHGAHSSSSSGSSTNGSSSSGSSNGAGTNGNGAAAAAAAAAAAHRAPPPPRINTAPPEEGGVSSYIVVTHQHSTIRRSVDRLIFLHEGRVVWEGSVQEFDTTDEPIVRQFASGSLDGPIIYL